MPEIEECPVSSDAMHQTIWFSVIKTASIQEACRKVNDAGRKNASVMLFFPFKRYKSSICFISIILLIF
jgi:hypothetical protein